MFPLRLVFNSPVFNTFSIKKFTFVSAFHISASTNEWNVYHLCKPDPLHHKCRRLIDYPKEYTVEPLKYRNLAGRDINTGRVVTARLGGGIKHPFHWVDFKKNGPSEENEYYFERVIQIIVCGCRSAHVALVGGNDKLRYILATANMQAGDLIKTSQFIPRHPVLANEGDSYPLGALPLDTLVHNIERMPGEGGVFIQAAGSSATIVRKVNKRVIVKMPSKLEISFDEKCMSSVGQVSNPGWQDIILGTPMKHRELGRRPKSGLFKKKTGRFGRKIKPPPPVKIMEVQKAEPFFSMRITIPHIPIKYPPNHV